MDLNLMAAFEKYLSQNNQTNNDTTASSTTTGTTTEATPGSNQPVNSTPSDTGSIMEGYISSPSNATTQTSYETYEDFYNALLGNGGDEFSDILSDGNIDEAEQEYIRENGLEDKFIAAFDIFDGFDSAFDGGFFSVIKGDNSGILKDISDDESNSDVSNLNNMDSSNVARSQNDSQALLASDILENMLGEDTLETLADASEVKTDTFDIDDKVDIHEIEQLNATEIKDFYDSQFTPVLNKAKSNEKLAIDNFYLSIDEKTRARNAYIDTSTQCTTKANELAQLKAQLSGKGNGLVEQDEMQEKNNQSLQDNKAGISGINNQLSSLKGRINEQQASVTRLSLDLHNAELNYAMCKANPPLNDGSSADAEKMKNLNDAKHAYDNARRAYELEMTKLNQLRENSRELKENKDDLEDKQSDLRKTDSNIEITIKMGDSTYSELQDRVDKAENELKVLTQARNMSYYHLKDTENNSDIAEINMNKAISTRIDMEEKNSEILEIYRNKINDENLNGEDENAQDKESYEVQKNEVKADEIHQTFKKENQDYLDKNKN